MTVVYLVIVLGVGFNRYMVECEFFLYLQFNCFDHGFNRYMVECESIKIVGIKLSGNVLIDTWWNVNAFLTGI